MRLITALLFAISLPAFAQHEHNHGSMQAAQPATPPLTGGIIKKIDTKAGEIVIQHGQLDSIGMPPMTMAFGVADKTWLDKMKAGDKIRFAAEMKGGNPVVSRYEPAK